MAIERWRLFLTRTRDCELILWLVSVPQPVFT
jgi:hypothetical protein